eukprot:gene15453-17294_t
MVLVAVRLDDILNRGSTPIELVHYITPLQWNIITQEVQNAFTEANFWSCCCEITICVIFLFPFIFCCHPCNTALIMKPRLDSKLKQINATMFGGRPVLRELNGNVLFNTEMIAVDTIYVDRTNTGEYSKSGEIAQVAIISLNNVQQPSNDGYVAIASPLNHTGTNAIPEKKQTMVVTVPPNAGPGSVLTVSAPNGSVLSVVVPQNSGPGRDIVVQY